MCRDYNVQDKWSCHTIHSNLIALEEIQFKDAIILARKHMNSQVGIDPNKDLNTNWIALYKITRGS